MPVNLRNLCQVVPSLTACALWAGGALGCAGETSAQDPREPEHLEAAPELPESGHFVNAYGEGSVQITWSADPPAGPDQRRAVEAAVRQAAEQRFARGLGAFMTGATPMYEGTLEAHSVWLLEGFAAMGGRNVLTKVEGRADLANARVVARLELDRLYQGQPARSLLHRLVAVAPAERHYIALVQAEAAEAPTDARVGAINPLDEMGVGFFAPCSDCLTSLAGKPDAIMISAVDATSTSPEFRTTAEGELQRLALRDITVQDILDCVDDSYEYGERLSGLQRVAPGRWERDETGSAAAIVGDCSVSVSFRTHWLANDGDPRASGFGDIEITSTRCLPPGGRS